MNTKLQKFLSDVKGQRISVLGLGRSNIPLINLLNNAGAIVIARDKNTVENLPPEISTLNIESYLGNNYLANLHEKMIFRTPGIHPYIPELVAAREHESIVTSEMELFFELCPAPIIGVTGSDGKTTTTTLIYEMLKRQGFKCWLGGNIGRPLIGDIAEIAPNDRVVVELSSFQLQTMTTNPNVAVITNITPNHLDYHKTMEEYSEAKANIFKNQSANSRLVLNYDNEGTRALQQDAHSEVLCFSLNNFGNNMVYKKDGSIYIEKNNNITEIMKCSDIVIPGAHNIENYMAAIAAVWGECSVEIIIDVARTFKGVPHRIEFVKEIDGVRYYNDSIATSPTRTRACLNSFDQKLVVIAGGYDKKIPFDDFGSDLINNVKTLILIGQTASLIESAVKNSPEYTDKKIDIIHNATLAEAVTTAKAHSVSGDVVVLSPACASFDMYKNFEIRGNEFKNLVNDLI